MLVKHTQKKNKYYFVIPEKTDYDFFRTKENRFDRKEPLNINFESSERGNRGEREKKKRAGK